MRIVAFILILLGLAVVGYDAIVFLDRGVFPLSAIGDIWALIHRNSLLLLEPAITRHVSEPLWDWIVFPLLQRSATAVFIGLGVAILIIRAVMRRRARRREGFTFKRR